MASAQQFWVDFTEQDLDLLQTQIYDFVYCVGEEKYGEKYIMGQLAKKNISGLVRAIRDGLTVECLADLNNYFLNKFILEGFELYQHRINWSFLENHNPGDQDEDFYQFVAREFELSKADTCTDGQSHALTTPRITIDHRFTKKEKSKTQMMEYLVDFSMYHDTEEIKFQLRDFITAVGKQKFTNYQLSYNIDIQIYDLMNPKKYAQDSKHVILGPEELTYHFKNKFVIDAFKHVSNDIKWMDEELLYGPHNCHIDFSVEGDVAQEKMFQSIRDFIYHEQNHWGLSQPQIDNVYKNLSHAILSKLYNKHPDYVFSSPADLKTWVHHDAVLNSFIRYFRKIRWASPVMKFVRNYEDAGETHVILVNFYTDDLEYLRGQLDSFATRAGKQFYDPLYLRSPTIEGQIDRLLDPRYYMQSREHTIRQPSDLARFFTQNFMQKAFCSYRDSINWIADKFEQGDMPYKHLPPDYFLRPPEPPFERVSDRSVLVKKASWLVSPFARKLLMQEELFSLIDQISAISSPIQLIPPIYALENKDHWSQTLLAVNVQGIKPYKTRVDFPSWINDNMTVSFAGKKMGLRTFLHHPSHCRFRQTYNVKQDYLTATNTVYYLVIYVPEFEARKNMPFYGREPSAYQIYIGEARKGVLDRWINQRYAHCRVTKRLLQHHSLQKSLGKGFIAYEPGPNDTNAQLPQCLLALAHVKSYPTALFVLNSCYNVEQMHNVEQELIDLHHARDMTRGLNQI